MCFESAIICINMDIQPHVIVVQPGNIIRFNLVDSVITGLQYLDLYPNLQFVMFGISVYIDSAIVDAKRQPVNYVIA